MHSYVTSKNVKWCHLIWPTLYNSKLFLTNAIADDLIGLDLLITVFVRLGKHMKCPL